MSDGRGTWGFEQKIRNFDQIYDFLAIKMIGKEFKILKKGGKDILP